MIEAFILLAAFLLDLALGDPAGWPHPVRWLGRVISFLEPILRRILPERLGGIVLLVLVTGISGGTCWGLLELAGWIHEGWRIIIAVLLVYFGLAAGSLARETGWVLEACGREDWIAARERLSRIVGRDTQELPPAEIYRACIETVAENTTDGIVAPLFWTALLGPVGLWVFKAISTLDSMVGYRNARYLYFGWASARADDLVNWIPARLCFLLMTAAAWLVGCSARNSWRVGLRDGGKHPSPNAGWAEAAMAGALDIQLGGTSTYAGVVCEKPLLGDGTEPLTLEHVHMTINVMWVTAWLAVAAACLTVAALAWLKIS